MVQKSIGNGNDPTGEYAWIHGPSNTSFVNETIINGTIY